MVDENWMRKVGFCCPACRSQSVVVTAEAMNCPLCHKTYPIIQGIPELLFDGKTIASLRMYEDPHYCAWRKMLADAQDYFYKPGSLVAYFQNAGHRRIRSELSKIRPAFLLDVGCGDGAHVPYLHDRTRYLGLDIDRASVLKLKKRFPDAEALVADGNRLPFADQSVPCIISVYNIEHMVLLDLAFEEMARVLMPDGIIMISVPAVDSYIVRIARQLTSVRHFQRDDFNYERASELEHVNCIWQIEKAIKRHFTIERRFGFPCGVPLISLCLIVTYRLRLR